MDLRLGHFPESLRTDSTAHTHSYSDEGSKSLVEEPSNHCSNVLVNFSASTL